MISACLSLVHHLFPSFFLSFPPLWLTLALTFSCLNLLLFLVLWVGVLFWSFQFPKKSNLIMNSQGKPTKLLHFLLCSSLFFHGSLPFSLPGSPSPSPFWEEEGKNEKKERKKKKFIDHMVLSEQQKIIIFSFFFFFFFFFFSLFFLRIVGLIVLPFQGSPATHTADSGWIWGGGAKQYFWMWISIPWLNPFWSFSLSPLKSLGPLSLSLSLSVCVVCGGGRHSFRMGKLILNDFPRFFGVFPLFFVATPLFIFRFFFFFSYCFFFL